MAYYFFLGDFGKIFEGRIKKEKRIKILKRVVFLREI